MFIAPAQGVINVTVESLSPTSLRLRWLPPSQNEWNGIISRYTIHYSLLGQVKEHDDDDELEGLLTEPLMTFVAYAPVNFELLNNNPDPRLATSPLVWEERVINGLEEYYVYSASIYFENSAGRSPTSESVQFSMPSDG